MEPRSLGRGRGRLERTLEIIEDGQELLEQVPLGELEVFRLVAVQALALVVHFGRRPEIAVLQDIALAAHVLEPLLEVLDLVFSFPQLPAQRPRVFMVVALFQLGRVRRRISLRGSGTLRRGGRLRGRGRQAVPVLVVFGLGVHLLFLRL